MPKFKLWMPIADSTSSNGGVVTASLCGYVVNNSEGYSWLDYRPKRFYRLIYRHRGKNGSGGTLPPASSSARPHNDDVIEGTVDAEQEERRLMATEESRQRYSMRPY